MTESPNSASLLPGQEQPEPRQDSSAGEKLTELESLLAVTQAVTSAQSLDQVMAEATKGAIRLLDADQGFIVFWKPETNELVTTHAPEHPGMMAREERIPAQSTASEQVILTQQALLL